MPTPDIPNNLTAADRKLAQSLLGMSFSAASPIGLNELVARQQEQQIGSPASEALEGLAGDLRRRLITPGTLAYYREPDVVAAQPNRRDFRSGWKYLLVLAGAVGLAGSGAAIVHDANLDLKPPTKAARAAALPSSSPSIIGVRPNSYYPCEEDYEPIAGNIFGPEENPACRENDPPLDILATDNVTDEKGDVIEQRVVVRGNQYWVAKRNPATHAFPPEYAFTSIIPMENVSSMISSSDGKTIIAGGTGLCVSYDGGKTWENIPESHPGPIASLTRFTDAYYLGNYMFQDKQFILEIDQHIKKVSVQPVVPSINAYQFRVASLDTPNNRAELIATSFPNGIGIMNVDYKTGLGTVRNITQTLVGDTLVDLNDLRGIGLSTVDGNMHIKTSDIYNQLLYDMNFATNPPVATRLYYANIFNNHGVPGYTNGSPKITTVDVSTNTIVGGYYTSSIDGKSRAFFGNLETTAFYDLSPNTESYIRLQPEGMQRLQFNGQKAYKLVGWPYGQIVVPDGGVLISINRGLGKFKVYLPSVPANQ